MQIPRMLNQLHALAILVLAGAFFTPARAATPVIAAGTSISVRLATPTGSDARFANTRIWAIVTAPVLVDGRIAIAPGTTVWGRVTQTGRDTKSRHILQLTFDSLALGDIRIALGMRITGVDNAREFVRDDGLILGAPAVSVARSRETWALMMLGAFHPVAAAVLFAEARVQSHARAAPISYGVGTDLSAQFTRDITLPAWTMATAPPAMSSSDSIRRRVHDWPLRAAAFAGRSPSDLLNVALIGDSAVLTNAFTAAGWNLPERMSVHADFKTFVNAAVGRGYAHQPVSQLLLDGRPPDLLFQKVNNTFAKRHHVRLWRWPSPLDSLPLYLAGATHDVAVEFLTHRKHFTHRVDPAIDAERDKIVNDLWTAGCVAELSRVPRQIPSGLTVNNGRDAVVTDGMIAVIKLRASCDVTSAH